METKEELEFDEQEAIRFILDFIPEEDKKGMSEDGNGTSEDGNGTSEDGNGTSEDGNGMTENRKGMTEDDVQYVLDIIYDYYEEKGLIEDDTAEAAEIDEDEMLDFVRKAAKKDKIALTDTQIQLIVEGEYEYGVSIGIYE